MDNEKNTDQQEFTDAFNNLRNSLRGFRESVDEFNETLEFVSEAKKGNIRTPDKILMSILSESNREASSF